MSNSNTLIDIYFDLTLNGLVEILLLLKLFYLTFIYNILYL